MSSWRIPLLFTACLSVACGSTTHDEAEAADAQPPSNPQMCDIAGAWGAPDQVLPAVTVPGDGFYALSHTQPGETYEVQRYDPLGKTSTIGTLAKPPGTVTRLFASDSALHYETDTDFELRHGPVGGPELVLPTNGRRIVDVQAADLGGLFVVFRELELDDYFYTIYDGVVERVTDAFTSMSSVHPRPGGAPVVARLTEDGRLLAGVAGEPMQELPSSCVAQRPYSVVALTNGGVAWAHGCETETSVIGLRTATGEVRVHLLDTRLQSVSLAEGPDGTLVVARVVSPGELAISYFDASLKETTRGVSYEIHVEGPYQFPLSAVSLSRMTIGAVFAISGRFDIPDGQIERLAFGTLCLE
jgi:hypothetical protein